jgi:methenyltetrahydromethanopterin cyclohydrolase
MSQPLSINQMAWQKAQKIINNPLLYSVAVSKSTAGATIIDAGVTAKGGFQAGKKLTELCLGSAGKAQLGFKIYGNLNLPSITISTDHPAIATLGSQFAGWRIKDGDQIAIGSGPIRALALKPKDIYDEIGYKDQSEKAVLTLESNVMPSDALIEKVTMASGIKAQNLIIVVAPTSSIAGLTQVAGRVVEVGIHKLRTLGLSPKTIQYAMGCAPIPPVYTAEQYTAQSTPTTKLPCRKSLTKHLQKHPKTTANHFYRSSAKQTKISTKSTMACSRLLYS